MTEQEQQDKFDRIALGALMEDAAKHSLPSAFYLTSDNMLVTWDSKGKPSVSKVESSKAADTTEE